MAKNLLSFIICVFFIFSAAISLSYMIAEADHECGGHDCPVCLHLQEIVNTVKQTVLLFAVAALFFVFSGLKSFVCFFHRTFFYKPPTLVSLKIIMND